MTLTGIDTGFKGISLVDASRSLLRLLMIMVVLSHHQCPVFILP